MDFDAFISYSSKDKVVANAACATLEAAGVRCWIAPRDIRPGHQYGAAIIDAIDHCRGMILIFSSNANNSQQIHREIERAVSKGVPIIPVRIEEIAPTQSMEYFLGAIHWLDALSPPLETHLQQLAETVKAVLHIDTAERGIAPPPDRTVRREAFAGQAVAAVPPASQQSGRRWLLPVVGAACAALLAGGGWFYMNRDRGAGMSGSIASPPAVQQADAAVAPTAPMPVEASPPAPPAPRQVEAAVAPPAPRQAVALVPELIPFISDRDRVSVRADYLPAQQHKALAIATASRMAFITGQKDEETAKTAALAACDKISSGRKCELYAVGDIVVSLAGRPPLPPEPWLLRNPAVERPFVADEVPLMSATDRAAVDKAYLKRTKSKALAVSSRRYSYFFGQGTPEEAIRRSLEACGSFAGVPCMVVAVDDVFVVPVPTTMTAVGMFHPASEVSIAPEARDDVARRMGNATSGWNAVAVGTSGRPGLGLGAAKEQEAIDGAVADCGRQDRGCRVIAIGPFLVGPKVP
jgi:TIR domain